MLDNLGGRCICCVVNTVVPRLPRGGKKTRRKKNRPTRWPRSFPPHTNTSTTSRGTSPMTQEESM